MSETLKWATFYTSILCVFAIYYLMSKFLLAEVTWQKEKVVLDYIVEKKIFNTWNYKENVLNILFNFWYYI